MRAARRPRSSGLAVIHLVIAFFAADFARADNAQINLAQFSVKKVDRSSRIVTFDTSKDTGIALDDQMVMTAPGGAVTIGRVFIYDEGHFAIKVDPDAAMPAPGDAAVRVPRDVGALMRSWLPPGSTLSARLDARSRSGATAWFDCGSLDGFRQGDRLMVLRNEIPIARATIAEVRDRVSLASLVPLVSNATCAAGDRVCIWPGPTDRNAGILETRVLFVKPVANSDRIEVWFPAEQRDGIEAGQHWEIRRAGDYVDCVEVVELRGRFAIALQSPAFAKSPIEVGDSAVLRTGAQVALGKMPLRVFRREGDYCLMNGGEDVDLEVGGRLAVVRDGRVTAELEIDTVKMDYCGATRAKSAGPVNLLATTRPGRDEDVRDWDTVVPASAMPAAVEPAALGRVERLLKSDEWLIGRPGRIGASVAPGQLVRIGTQPDSVGLVVSVAEGSWVVHVPPSCRRGTIATGRRDLAALTCSVSFMNLFQPENLILASTSERRRALLQSAGYQFRVAAPLVDEPATPRNHPCGAAHAESLAFFKASSLSEPFHDCVLLGADTIAVIGDELIGKPADRDDARRILQRLAATTHSVITGVALMRPSTGRRIIRHDETHLRVRPLTSAAIEAYLDTNAWRGKAGAYGIQDQNDPFVERLEGSFSNVVGLPMELLAKMLVEFGNGE